jgi:hypothetical protein
VANLRKGKLKILFDLKPQIPEHVLESALEPSVYQSRACSENSGFFDSPMILVYDDFGFKNPRLAAQVLCGYNPRGLGLINSSLAAHLISGYEQQCLGLINPRIAAQVLRGYEP